MRVSYFEVCCWGASFLEECPGHERIAPTPVYWYVVSQWRCIGLQKGLVPAVTISPVGAIIFRDS